VRSDNGNPCHDWENGPFVGFVGFLGCIGRWDGRGARIARRLSGNPASPIGKLTTKTDKSARWATKEVLPMPNALVQTLTKKEQKDLWRTPLSTFERAAGRWGPFHLDAAATVENRHCPAWLGPGSPLGEDALAVSWHIAEEGITRVWCNPPYSRNRAFVAKAAAEAATGLVQATLLLPASTDVAWWHDHVWDDDGERPGVLVQLLRGRIRFLRHDGSVAVDKKGKKTGPNFGSALVTFLSRGGR
jgi:phage N-6-adenine-methyltransferase